MHSGTTVKERKRERQQTKNDEASCVVAGWSEATSVREGRRSVAAGLVISILTRQILRTRIQTSKTRIDSLTLLVVYHKLFNTHLLYLFAFILFISSAALLLGWPTSKASSRFLGSMIFCKLQRDRNAEREREREYEHTQTTRRRGHTSGLQERT